MLDAGTLLNIFKVQSLLKAVSKSLLVDPGLDLLKLASTFASMAEGNLNLQTIPTDGFDNNTPVGDVVVVNPAEVQAFAANLVGTKVDSKISSAPTVSPATVNVVVLNASNADGIATTNANALKVLGFKATVGNNTAGTTVTTEIEYTNGMQSQAKTLAAQVPGAKLVETSLVKTVTLRLGTDGLQVKSLRTTSGASATKTTTTPAVVVPVGTGRTGVPNQPGCIN
jgi:hypothetical protein